MFFYVVFESFYGCVNALFFRQALRFFPDQKELFNQEKIVKLGEKENRMYLGILEADTVKQAEMKEKNNKIIT